MFYMFLWYAVKNRLKGGIFMAKTYVLDTNVLIQAPYAMQCFEDNHVVIPLVVVEELDGLKKRMVNAGLMPGKPSAFWNV